MKLIDADALLADFKARAIKARNWKENAILKGNEEATIRADATIAFLTEVKLTIENAPTIDTTFREVVAYECGQKSVEERPAEWEYTDGRWGLGDWRCSKCGGYSNKDTHYCPNCGRRMKNG